MIRLALACFKLKINELGFWRCLRVAIEDDLTVDREMNYMLHSLEGDRLPCANRCANDLRYSFLSLLPLTLGEDSIKID